MYLKTTAFALSLITFATVASAATIHAPGAEDFQWSEVKKGWAIHAKVDGLIWWVKVTPMETKV